MLKIDYPAPLKVKSDTPLVTPQPDELWIRTTDDVHKIAADLIDKLDDEPHVNLACIGAGCLNQAIKAVAVARERLNKHNEDMIMQPYFSSFIDDQSRGRTRMMLRVTVVDV